MQVDTLIHARWIIPVEPESVTPANASDTVFGQWHEHATLVIDNGRIVDLLPSDQARRKYQATVIEELDNHALLPGLINSHTHAAMTLLRGIADDLQLMDWLQNHIWPLEQKWIYGRHMLRLAGGQMPFCIAKKQRVPFYATAISCFVSAVN